MRSRKHRQPRHPHTGARNLLLQPTVVVVKEHIKVEEGGEPGINGKKGRSAAAKRLRDGHPESYPPADSIKGKVIIGG